MKIEKTALEGLVIIHTDVFGDHRGWFTESYNEQKYSDLGINVKFIQDNHSFSKEKGTLRGLHFQRGAFAQSKLIRCTRGRLLDICVDLRKESETYLKYVSVELSDSNNLQLFVPKGFAHGFVTLVDDVEIMYKVDTYYSKVHDSGIRYNDPSLNINWSELVGMDKFILSSKDEQLGFIKDMDIEF